jgi:hypothetical protein
MSYGQIGMMQALAGFFTFFVIMELKTVCGRNIFLICASDGTRKPSTIF